MLSEEFDLLLVSGGDPFTPCFGLSAGMGEACCTSVVEFLSRDGLGTTSVISRPLPGRSGGTLNHVKDAAVVKLDVRRRHSNLFPTLRVLSVEERNISNLANHQSS